MGCTYPSKTEGGRIIAFTCGEYGQTGRGRGHTNTIKSALAVLKAGNWIDVVRIGSERGGVNAYFVNRRVAWADKRENQRFASFDARIIVSAKEQKQETLESSESLRQLPGVGEIQIPTGEGLDPPSQPVLGGLEPELPAVKGDEHLEENFL